MNPDVINALVAAGLLDPATADIIRRQQDIDAARLWAETIVAEATQAGLSAQQQRLVELVARTNGRPSATDLATFWAGENDLLLAALRPSLLSVASERATFAAVASERATFAAVAGGQANAFALINQQVIAWAEDYYINPDAGVYGSVPNLNLTSRTQFANAFIEWQRGELEVGRPTGLPQLIDALTPIFGPVRAEAIGVTETTRLFVWSQRIAEENNPFTVAFRWLTSADERVCPICGPRHGEVRRKNRDFSGGVDIPAHVRCRCHETPETEATLALPLPPEERFV